ncbi:MAG: hypothetical protein EOO77_26500 [Oxalobacteraceae bacterium]|nr:MAG: hypothetical protein EOO77_26500 [Oxalobacteraceae bacterium]
MACEHFHSRKLFWLFSRKGWEIGWRYLLGATMPMGPEHAVRWMPKDRKKIDYTEATAWLETDEAKGLYWCDTAWPDIMEVNERGNKYAHVDDLGNIWRFTDPNTAFAFKMRFL